MKKRILGVICFAVMLAILIGACGNSSPSNSSPTAEVTTPAVVESSTAETTPTEEPVVEPEPTTEPEPTVMAFEEQVIYETDDYKVTATDFTDEFIKLTIENNTELNVCFQAWELSVNGYMIDCSFSAEVAAGKKSVEKIRFDETDMKAAGIDKIGYCEFILHIFNSDTWDTIADSDVIYLQSANYESIEYIYDDSGTVVYDNNGVKIVYKYFNEESWSGPQLMFYAYNTMDKTICIQVRDVSIDGFMADGMCSSEIASDKHCIFHVTLESYDNEELLEDFNTVEFKFHIFDNSNLNTIVDSDIIAINVKD